MKTATKMYLVMMLMMACIMVYQYQQLKTGLTSMQWTGAKNTTSNNIDANEVRIQFRMIFFMVWRCFSMVDAPPWYVRVFFLPFCLICDAERCGEWSPSCIFMNFAYLELRVFINFEQLKLCISMDFTRAMLVNKIQSRSANEDSFEEEFAAF